jgi:hypothetical protein
VAVYKGGDMAGANRDFLLLASVGLATADLNLSMMAARGERWSGDRARRVLAGSASQA